MSTVTLADAQDHLPELIAKLTPNEPVIILEGGRPVARLMAEAAPVRPNRTAGSAKGLLTIHAEDDDHLSDFESYLK